MTENENPERQGPGGAEPTPQEEGDAPTHEEPPGPPPEAAPGQKDVSNPRQP